MDLFTLASLVIAFIVVGATWFWFAYFDRFQDYRHDPKVAPKKFSEIPTIFEPVGLFGNMLQFDPTTYHVTMTEWARKTQNFFRMRVFYIYMVSANQPDMIRDVMVNVLQKSSSYEGAKGLIGEGLLTSHGELWKRQRRIIEPAFHIDNLKITANVTKKRILQMFERWDQLIDQGKGQMEARKEIMRLTLDVIGIVGFDYDFKSVLTADSSNPEESLDVIFEHVLNGIEEKIWHFSRLQTYLPFGRMPKYRRSLAKLRKIAKDQIKSRLATEELKGREDILSGLIKEFRKNGTQVTEKDKLQLEDELLTFLFAGHDTTATTISFAMYLLAVNPHIQKQLQEEVDNVMKMNGVDKDTLDYFTLDKFKLLDRVWKETLRLYPPAFFLGRKTDKPINLGGYYIPEGTDLGISSWIIHRDPTYWPDPEKFDPDRFLPENSQNRHQYVYIPFFLPPRSCIGQRLAIVEGRMALALISHLYTIERPKDAPPIEVEPATTLKPKHGIHIRLVKRNRN